MVLMEIKMFFVFILLLGANCILGEHSLNQSDEDSNNQENLSNQSSNIPNDVILTDDNFKEMVLDSDDFWMVGFYPDYLNSIKFQQEWKKAASQLKGVKLGHYNTATDSTFRDRYNISGYPDIRLFPADNKTDTKVEKYKYSWEALHMVPFVRAKQAITQPDIITLTDSNFKELVLDSEDLWLVNFYVLWCPNYGQPFALEWAKVAIELRGKVKVGAYDANANGLISQQYGIYTSRTGYPNVKVFAAGKKLNNSVTSYDGQLTSCDILLWAHLELNNPALETSQQFVTTLTNDNFKELVLDSQDPWLVNFYAERDNTASEELVPVLAHVAYALQGKVKVGALAAYSNWKTFQTQCKEPIAPTIKMYAAGNKTDSNVKIFQQPRKANYLYGWALQNLPINVTNTLV